MYSFASNTTCLKLFQGIHSMNIVATFITVLAWPSGMGVFHGNNAHGSMAHYLAYLVCKFLHLIAVKRELCIKLISVHFFQNYVLCNLHKAPS